MNRDLHDITPLPIYGNEGWQQMELLLNRHLPVQKKMINKRLLQSYRAAMLFFTPLLFISLPLNTGILLLGMLRNTGVAAAQNTTVTFLPAALNSAKNSKGLATYLNKFGSGKKNCVPLFFNHEVAVDTSNSMFSAKTITAPTQESIDESSVINKQVNATSVTIKDPAATTTDTLTPATGKSINIRNKRSWSLLAGIGANAAIGQQQKLQPYPIAVAKYNISSKFYIAASAAACSLVASNISGVSKTIYLNDTVNNIQLYKETTTYNTLYYVDIPLTAGINISKKFAVQAGMQLSWLLNKKATKITAPYDFQMNSIAAINTDPSITANAQQQYSVPVRNIDYRFITGLRYTINKVVIGADYQYGLQPAGNGSNNSRNKVIALSVVFKIK